MKRDLRIFGICWGAVFAVMGLFPLMNGEDVRLWSVAVSAVFFVIAVTYPMLFKKIYLYQVWVAFGGVMGYINSRIIISILFVVIFVPVGLVLKLFRSDLLHTHLDKKSTSFFIDRACQPEDMRNQF